MNINISTISNGFVLTIATKDGQSAIYCSTWEEVLKQLNEVKVVVPTPSK